MEIIRYIGKILGVPFTHSLGIAQDIIFVFVIVSGFATYYFKHHASEYVQGVPDLTVWQVATAVLLSILLIRLLLAPYWVWKEQEGRIAQLNAEADRISHRMAARERGRQQLQNMYIQCGNMFEHPFKPDATPAQIAEFCEEVNAWIKLGTEWIAKNISSSVEISRGKPSWPRKLGSRPNGRTWGSTKAIGCCAA